MSTIGNSFEWVAYNGSEQLVGSETRTRIRRQAMSLAAQARKQRRRDALPEQDSSSIATSSGSDRNPPTEMVRYPRSACRETRRASPPSEQTHLLALPQSPRIHINMILQYLASSGIDVLEFSSFMKQIHIGRVAKPFLSRHPERITTMLRHTRPSFRSESVLRLEERGECFQLATECLALRLYELLSTSSHIPREATLYAHGKALRSLNKAVLRDGSRPSADVLFAAEALSLFSIIDLDPSSHDDDQAAWSRHVRGIAGIIQLRGPSGFSTEYERMLLFSMASSIVCECVYQNQPCFLDGEDWLSIFRESVDPDETQLFFHSDISIALWGFYVQVPRLLRDVGAAVCHPQNLSKVEWQDLRKRIRSYHSDLLRWRCEFQSRLALSLSGDGECYPVSDVLSSRLAMQGTSLSLSIMSKRLLAAVCPENLTLLEEEVCILSHELNKLSAMVGERDAWTGLLLCQKVMSSNAALKTSAMWKQHQCEDQEPRSPSIEKWRFAAWCRAMPRRICCDDGSQDEDVQLVWPNHG